MVPNLIRVFNHENFEFNAKKIYTSYLFFSDQIETIEKLKFQR